MTNAHKRPIFAYLNAMKYLHCINNTLRDPYTQQYSEAIFINPNKFGEVFEERLVNIASEYILYKLPLLMLKPLLHRGHAGDTVGSFGTSVLKDILSYMKQMVEMKSFA